MFVYLCEKVEVRLNIILERGYLIVFVNQIRNLLVSICELFSQMCCLSSFLINLFYLFGDVHSQHVKLTDVLLFLLVKLFQLNLTVKLRLD